MVKILSSTKKAVVNANERKRFRFSGLHTIKFDQNLLRKHQGKIACNQVTSILRQWIGFENEHIGHRVKYRSHTVLIL